MKEVGIIYATMSFLEEQQDKNVLNNKGVLSHCWATTLCLRTASGSQTLQSV